MTSNLSRTLLAVLTAAALGAVPSTAHASSRMCSSTYGGDIISATNLSCRQAHKLVRGWAHNAKRDGRYDRKQFGFTCRNRPSTEEGATMDCRKGRQQVRWYVNLP